MKRHFSSLSFKYTVIIDLILIAALISTNVLIFGKLYNKIESESIETVELETESNANELALWFENYRGRTEALAASIEAIPTDKLDLIQEMFQANLAADDTVTLYFVVYEDHTSVFSDYWEPAPDYDFDTCDFYYNPYHNNGEFTYVEAQYDVPSESLVVILGLKLDNNAVVGSFVNVNTVVDKINSINEESGDSGYSFLVDSAGHIIAHPDPDCMQKDDVSVHMNDLIDKHYDILYQKFFNENEKIVKLNFASGDMYFTSSKVSDTGWRLIHATPESEITGFRYTVETYIFLIIITAIILISILTILTFAVLTARLKKASDGLELFANGKFYEYKLSNSKRNDEIGDLQRNMDKLKITLATMDRDSEDGKTKLNSNQIEL